MRVVREDLRGGEELSNVAAFSAGPSPHENCLAEETFVVVRGGMLETEGASTEPHSGRPKGSHRGPK